MNNEENFLEDLVKSMTKNCIQINVGKGHCWWVPTGEVCEVIVSAILRNNSLGRVEQIIKDLMLSGI